MPVTTRQQAREILRGLADRADEEIDLAEAALALAVLDRPEVPLDRYRHHLALLARDVAERAAAGPDDLEHRASALRDVIIGRYRYEGDNLTYDDLQNANLIRVIDRRKGLPVTLGILFIHAARAQGWNMVGLNFPGHFLVRLDHESERAIIDPFNEGRRRDVVELRELLKATAGAAAELTPQHYAAVSNREILVRLQNNLKLRFMRGDQVNKAIDVIDSMLLFAPGEATLWRESGLLNAHVGNLTTAIAALETFIRIGEGERMLHQAAILLQQLKARLN